MRIITLLCISFSVSVLATIPAQELRKSQVCKASALAAVKPVPKLRYKCRAGVNDYDDEVLKWPERLQALRIVERTLQTFSDTRWWQTDVNDLNVCEFRKRPGELSQDELEKFDNDYSNAFVGNQNFRLAIVSDPCYQVGYDGSVIFLLVKGDHATTVSKLFDGYFSRVNNSVGFDWANLNAEPILELETANSFPPSLANYYFSIDKRTHRAVPRKLFKDGSKFTSEIWRDMLMSEAADLDLPDDAVELHVIKDHKLAPSFSIYSEDADGTIESAGKKFKRIIYHWNGKFYEAQR